MTNIFNRFLLAVLFMAPISLQTQTRNAAYYKEQGDTQRVQKNRLQAIEWYTKSIRANKNYVPAMTALGSILRETGALNDSLAYLARAHKLEPKNENVIQELAITFLKLNGLSQARKVLAKGLAISPYKADFNYLMAEIYLKEKRQYLAKRKLETIIKSNPGHYNSYLLLGEIYLREKRYDRAEGDFEKAKLIQPENPTVFLKLANIKLNQIIDEKEDLLYDTKLDKQIFREPINLMLNAKGFDNSLVDANLGLAKIYALTRNCSEARPYLQTVLAVNRKHYTARYYQGFCNAAISLKIYPQLLQENYNDEITRYFLEYNMINQYRKRTHPNILKAARKHYRSGKNLMAAYSQVKALYEYRWSLLLYPSFIKAHEKMLDYYRTQNDFINMKRELNFLRRATKNVKYKDMYEQYIQRRRNKLYVREGYGDPGAEKNPTGLFVFYFKPKNPFGNYPNAGKAIADKLVFALKSQGRISVFSDRIRSQLYRQLMAQNYFGLGGYYNGNSGKFVRRQVKEIIERDGRAEKIDGNTIRYTGLRYAVSGDYEEIAGGLAVNLRIVDLETGLTFAPKKLIIRGNGYLRNLAIKFADHIYKAIPFNGRVLKISRNGAVINLGKRDGISKRSKLAVFRENQKVADLRIAQVDMDILWARTRNFENIYRIRPGDEIRVSR